MFYAIWGALLSRTEPFNTSNNFIQISKSAKPNFEIFYFQFVLRTIISASNFYTISGKELSISNHHVNK